MTISQPRKLNLQAVRYLLRQPHLLAALFRESWQFGRSHLMLKLSSLMPLKMDIDTCRGASTQLRYDFTQNVETRVRLSGTQTLPLPSGCIPIRVRGTAQSLCTSSSCRCKSFRLLVSRSQFLEQHIVFEAV